MNIDWKAGLKRFGSLAKRFLIWLWKDLKIFWKGLSPNYRKLILYLVALLLGMAEPWGILGSIGTWIRAGLVLVGALGVYSWFGDLDKGSKKRKTK